MGDEANKIYVGGLAVETSNESLRNHFLQFGEVTECVVMMDKMSGRSRGFGFVTFKDSSAVSASLRTAQVVDGRGVSCKKANPEGPPICAGPGHEGDPNYNVVKIFVGGLPATADQEKFSAFFSQFGKIEDAIVMVDNVTGRHRGFGYVTFAESAAVEATIQNYSTNQIDGKWIEVKRCIPQDKMAPGSSSKGKGKGKAGYGAMGGYGAFGPGAAYGAFSYSAAAAAAAYSAYNGMGGGLPTAPFGLSAYGNMASGYGAYAAAGYGASNTGYGGYSPY